ncbi:3-hydroxybutyrate dehydrogenase [Oligella ureolytica]
MTKANYSLDGQVALITGSGSGLGRDMALRFAAAGAAIGVADLNLEGAQKVVAEIEGAGGGQMAIEMDVTNEEQVNQGVDALVAHFGVVDVLISNAGIQIIESIDKFEYTQVEENVGNSFGWCFLDN